MFAWELTQEVVLLMEILLDKGNYDIFEENMFPKKNY